jgi:hypothetical protein
VMSSKIVRMRSYYSTAQWPLRKCDSGGGHCGFLLVELSLRKPKFTLRITMAAPSWPS